jgi:hypothetical protein
MNMLTMKSPPTNAPHMDALPTEIVDGRWKQLYVAGGIAALIVAAMTVAGVITFLLWPPPEGTVAVWFALFERNWLIGMLDLDLMVLLSFVANIPVILALYIALRRSGESLMALAATLALIAIATYFASSRLFEMLALSRQYAEATTDSQRAMLEAAAQSMLTTYLGQFGGPAPLPGWNYQGTAFNLSFVLWSVAATMIALVMRRSAVFGRTMSSVGIAGNLAALGLFAPVIGVALSLLSLPLLLVWYVLIARTLLWLASGATTLTDER